MAAAAPDFVCGSENRDLWLMERTQGVGSSDAPAILGLEKAWGNPFSIACLKRGIRPPEGDTESELLKWGHYVEAPMIAAFADETGYEAKLSGDMYRSTAPDLEFQMTTLDGVVTTDDGKTGGIECKLSIYTATEWEKYGVPEHVLCQNQHTMAVMGWDFVYTLALLDGYRLRYKRVDRADEVIGDLLNPAEQDFWRRLQAGEEFDAGVGRPDQSAAFLKHLHPDDNGETIDLPEAMIQTMDRWALAKEREKAAKKEADQAKNTLIQAMGDHTFGRLTDGRRVSFKTQERSAYQAKASKFRVMRETK